ncbi:MAG: bifunctional UDP-N-acetylglucosamine diphosphorylase/glucosamine-1-phosphate N-acetyltransferase GlmU [Gammaproteobacteria bacterium]|nr:bifunctional UDP-N-acetylglucosamine diphosphorylase/glucosamine-1-phosphate N-acetyltransferase GlmU [Gammaproteobacteria bacterium]
MNQSQAIILAAGQGKRMQSALPKVLHPVGGTPMLGRVLAAARTAGLSVGHVVLGDGAEQVCAWLQAHAGGVHTVLQPLQLGTADAVRQALPQIDDDALVVVLYGDVPLIRPQTLRALAAGAGDGLALVTAALDEPGGYGRILRDARGRVSGIVEDRDASVEQRAIREINSGLLAAPARRLKHWLAKIGNDNAQGEYYLTDVVALAAADGIEIKTVTATRDEIEGVNDRAQLARAERRFQRAQADTLLREGLQLADPGRFDLRGRLQFGRDVFIDVGCVLEGEIELADGVGIGPHCVLRDVALGAGTRVASHCVLESARVGKNARIGPFARLRPGAELADQVHVGNFVEIKNSVLGEGAKANHLSYLGDATVGARVNVGAGVITCNYDGVLKHRTVIGDDAFIGTDSQLVAPVTIGDRAYIAAGSTIARDAPADALTVCRAREQKSYSDWQPPAGKKRRT